jgi:hypothetical protein
VSEFDKGDAHRLSAGYNAARFGAGRWHPAESTTNTPGNVRAPIGEKPAAWTLAHFVIDPLIETTKC